MLAVADGDRPWTVFISSHDIDEVERIADWIGVLNEGRLELAEPVSSLLGRFRRVEVEAEGGATPHPPPATWLQTEAAGRTVRFVDTAWDESASVSRIRAAISGAGAVTAAEMTLREIFICLARRYRLPDSEGGAA
jgi:ABC-2 type transport system ATP-binding protein